MPNGGAHVWQADSPVISNIFKMSELQGLGWLILPMSDRDNSDSPSYIHLIPCFHLECTRYFVTLCLSLCFILVEHSREIHFFEATSGLLWNLQNIGYLPFSLTQCPVTLGGHQWSAFPDLSVYWTMRPYLVLFIFHFAISITFTAESTPMDWWVHHFRVKSYIYFIYSRVYKILRSFLGGGRQTSTCRTM